MKYTRIPTDTFKNIQMNAGILVDSFDPATGEVGNLIGATTGGINFTDTPSFTDFGDDIDNCPKNTKELKKMESRDVKMSGTFVTITVATAKKLAGAADIDSDNSSHIIPRNDIEAGDFGDIWWIGDYSDTNTGNNAGFVAIKLINALSTTGFQIQSTDKNKGQFAFEFTGHYSIASQDIVPYEIYVKSGSASTEPMIYLDKHTVSITSTGSYTFTPTVVPADSTITWNSSSTSVATVEDGVVSAEGAGNCIITASITVSGVTYNDTCTVIVED